MPSYTFRIKKADHFIPDKGNLHVHVYYNEGSSHQRIGRYCLPSLQPVFPNEPELTKREIGAIKEWLAKPEQIRKLQSCLRDTLFDTHKIVRNIPEFSDVITDNEGETYINIRIPVSRRIK